MKIKAEKDKHLYSIVPFEYKVKSPVEHQEPAQTLKYTPLGNLENDSPLNEPEDDNIIRKSDLKTEIKEIKPSLSLKNKKSKRRVDSISSDISALDHNEMNISNNSIGKPQDESFKNANKEIVFEISKDVKDESQSKPITPRDENILNPSVSNPIKDTSYESPQKCQTEDDWNFKLPSIKSSSGHDNFRNSQSENNHENKDRHNHSISIEMLEGSAEVTMFITEKDLSPRNLNYDGQNSHIRSRINSLRVNDTKLIEDNEKTQSLRISDFNKIDVNKENINNDEMVSSTKVNDNQNLLKKFELMKEPDVNVLEQAFKRDSAKKLKQVKQKEQTDHCVGLLYDYIVQNVMTDMFPQRVNVELLRSNSIDEVNQDEESQSQNNDKIHDISTSEKEYQSDDDQSQSDLKLITDSSSVQKYVNEIMDEIQANFFQQTVSNLSKPLRFDNLKLLRDLQGLDYDVKPSPEYETKPIADIQIYLNKERNDKARKEKEFDEKLEEADDSDPQNSVQMRKKLFNYL